MNKEKDRNIFFLGTTQETQNEDYPQSVIRPL